jgi:hypothetical protein
MTIGIDARVNENYRRAVGMLISTIKHELRSICVDNL